MNSTVFPHSCCDGHEPIGFANGPAESVESCPVCLARAESAELRGALDQMLRAYEMVWIDEGGSQRAFELCGSVKRARVILAATANATG